VKMVERRKSLGTATKVQMSLDELRQVAIAREMAGPRGIMKDGSSRSSFPFRSRSISFETVQIREYKRDICDNPSVTSGPPIGIDWEVKDESFVPVDIYETYRPERLEFSELILERHEREYLILKSGRTRTDIASAVREVNKAKHARRTTVNNIGTAAVIEEIFESAVRKMKRHLHKNEDDITSGIDFRTYDKLRLQARERLRRTECAKMTEIMSHSSKSLESFKEEDFEDLNDDVESADFESTLPKVGRVMMYSTTNIMRPLPKASSVSRSSSTIDSEAGSAPGVCDLSSLKKAPIQLCSERDEEE